MRKTLFIILFLGCISSYGQRMVLTTRWLAQSQFAGYYAAEQLGYYKSEGLDVVIRHPSTSENLYTTLKDKKTDIAIMYLSDALYLKAAGEKIVNIMQTSQQSSLIFVSHYKLHSMKDMDKYRVGMWRFITQEYLDKIFAVWGIRTDRIIRFSHGVNAFLSGALDVQIVTSYNEYYTLQECGFNCKYAMRWSDYGINMPEDGLYVTEDYYNKHKMEIAKFVSASRKGWNWVAANKDKALKIVMQQVRNNNVGSNIYHQRKQLNEILRLQTDKATGKRTFRLSRNNFNKSLDMLKFRGKIDYDDMVK